MVTLNIKEENSIHLKELQEGQIARIVKWIYESYSR